MADLTVKDELLYVNKRLVTGEPCSLPKAVSLPQLGSSLSLSSTLLAQLGFDPISTNTVGGIPSRRHRLRMDQHKF